MIIGLLWITTGLVIAYASGVPNSELFGTAQDTAAATWHLTLTGVLGLLLAAEGCRMFQAGWFMRR